MHCCPLFRPHVLSYPKPFLRSYSISTHRCAVDPSLEVTDFVARTRPESFRLFKSRSKSAPGVSTSPGIAGDLEERPVVALTINIVIILARSAWPFISLGITGMTSLIWWMAAGSGRLDKFAGSRLTSKVYVDGRGERRAFGAGGRCTRLICCEGVNTLGLADRGAILPPRSGVPASLRMLLSL